MRLHVNTILECSVETYAPSVSVGGFISALWFASHNPAQGLPNAWYLLNDAL